MNTKAVINRTNNGQPVGTDKTGTLRLPYRIRLLSDSVPLYTGAGREYAERIVI